MRTFILACFCMATTIILAQKEDFIWTMGYDGNPLPGKQTYLMDFRQNVLKIDYQDIGLEMGNTNTSICSKTGDLLFYTNGCQVFNADYQILQNGDTIVEPAYKEFCVNQDYYRTADGAIALPWPTKSGVFAIVQVGVYYQYQPVLAGWTAQLSFAKVDMNENIGHGAVIEKNVQIIWDSLGGGQLEAVRHANGRDWWIVQTRLKTNKYFVFLFDHSGIHLDHEQLIGPVCNEKQNYMQARFSPDGTKYAKTYDADEVWLFDFDRCNGSFSNFRKITVIGTDSIFAAPTLGLAFSPNSKFLYVSNLNHLAQYDLSASDINDSRIEIEKYTPNLVYPDYFGRMALGPDGQIYMDVSNGGWQMHIIHSPDKQGLSSGQTH